MKFQTILLSGMLSLASCGISFIAQAETVNSRCDIYPRGSDRVSKVVNCTFYQRQGNVTIEREDGGTYEVLVKGDGYVDQNGKPVTRENDAGAIIFRFVKESVYLYQGESAPSTNNQSQSSSRKITCESNNGKVQTCPINAPNGVTLVNQLSKNSCNGNWDYRNGYIEVSNGCRAEFEVKNNNHNSNQNSNDNEQNQGDNNNSNLSKADKLDACQNAVSLKYNIKYNQVQVNLIGNNSVAWTLPNDRSGSCIINSDGSVTFGQG